MAVRMRSAWWVLVLVAGAAHAEDVAFRQKLADTPARVHGADTLIPTPGGAYLSIGGGSLRILKPGARKPELLHRLPGDNVYRVAANETGDVLAVWETDPRIHLFTAAGRHLTFPKPRTSDPSVNHFQVEFLAFRPGGRDALVHMGGWRTLTGIDLDATYRVPLDGQGAPELLYSVDGAYLLTVTRDVALFQMPKNPGRQHCEVRTCDPVEEVFAVEFTPRGARKTVLLSSEQLHINNAHMVWSSRLTWDPGTDSFALTISTGRNERRLLRWRRGQPQGELLPFPKSENTEELRLMRNGDVLLAVVARMDRLTLRRFRPDGTEQVLSVPASQHRGDWDQDLYGLGERADGRLWVHWGDYLLLFPREAGRTPRVQPLEPMRPRRTTWGGVGIYQPAPEGLWLALEVGGGRDFLRLNLDDVERRAKPWAPYRHGAAQAPVPARRR